MSDFSLLIEDATSRATLTATSSNGTLLPSNMKTNDPEVVWRATAKTATITVTWASPEAVSCAILGWSNFTSSATVTASAFTNTADGSPVMTKTVNVDSDLPEGLLAFGLNPAIGGAAAAKTLVNAQVWFDRVENIRKLTLAISDTSNPENVQVGKLMTGVGYKTSLDPLAGASLALIDKSEVTRTESGTVRRDPSRIHRRLSLSFTMLDEADSLMLLRLAAMGKGVLMFVSLSPSYGSTRHQTHGFIGYLFSEHSQSMFLGNRVSTPLIIDEAL